MRSVWISGKGGPEVLEVREAPAPEPGPGALRIDVKASGINFADVLARMGLYPDAPPLPAVVGYEVAGMVGAVGPQQPDGAPRVGDRVLAFTRFGGYAEQVVVDSEQAALLPEGVSFEEGAALPVNYLTAWLSLIHLTNVQAGDTVLVHGVAGGVGQAALQLCLWRGARVIGTASPSKHERLRSLGVEVCVDSRDGDVEVEVHKATGGRGVDVALDPIGGRSFTRSYRSLAPMGRLVMFGVQSFSTGPRRRLLDTVKGLVTMQPFHPVPLMNNNRGVIGLNLGHLWGERVRIRAGLGELLRLVGHRTLQPVIDSTFPFERAGEAHAHLQSRKSFGKVLLTP